MANKNAEWKLVKGVIPGVIFGTIMVIAIGLIGRKATERKK